MLESLWFGYSSFPLCKQTLQEFRFCEAKTSQISPEKGKLKPPNGKALAALFQKAKKIPNISW